MTGPGGLVETGRPDLNHVSTYIPPSIPRNEYPWIDSQRKILKVSAPQYVDFATSLIQSQLNDESIFPTKAGWLTADEVD
jgi:hypothetical protein